MKYRYQAIRLSVESSIWFIRTFSFAGGKGGDRGGRGKKVPRCAVFYPALLGDSRCHVGSEVPGKLQRTSRWEGS